MGFQTQICSIFRFSWSILVKCCVHLRMSSRKTQMLLLEKTIFHKYWLFCKRFIVFTFDLYGLLSFVCHSQTIAKTMKLLRRPISAFLTGFRTDFASSVWNFCCWVADFPPRETSLSHDERGETSAVRRLFDHITWAKLNRLLTGVGWPSRSEPNVRSFPSSETGNFSWPASAHAAYRMGAAWP